MCIEVEILIYKILRVCICGKINILVVVIILRFYIVIVYLFWGIEELVVSF